MAASETTGIARPYSTFTEQERLARPLILLVYVAPNSNAQQETDSDNECWPEGSEIDPFLASPQEGIPEYLTS